MQRLFFLDNLKAFVVNWMILLHIALCYIVMPLPWWYVLDPQPSVGLNYFVMITDMVIMPIMFFISGYFAIRSLAKKTGKDFWMPKWTRIGIPWLIGILIIAPLTSIIMPYSRGLCNDIWTALTKYYWYDAATGGAGEFFNQVPFWYLGMLLLLYAITYFIVKIRPSYAQQKAPSSPKIWLFLGLTVFTFINGMVIDMITGDEYLWVNFFYILKVQVSRVLLYVLYFFLGIHAWRRHWFEEGCYVPSAAKWTPLFIISAAFIDWSFIHSPAIVSSPLEFLFYISISHAMLLTSSVFALLGIFYRFCNFTNNTLGNLASTSYTMYFCHTIFIFWPSLYMMNMNIHAFYKFIIAVIITWPITFICGKLLLNSSLFAGSKKAKVTSPESNPILASSK